MASALSDLSELDAVAVAPAGWPTPGRTVELPLADDVFLPLVVIWPAGGATTAVDRLRAALS